MFISRILKLSTSGLLSHVYCSVLICEIRITKKGKFVLKTLSILNNYPGSTQLQNVRNYIVDMHLSNQIREEQLLNGGRVQ